MYRGTADKYIPPISPSAWPAAPTTANGYPMHSGVDAAVEEAPSGSSPKRAF
jgi:hypothetical protein